MVLSGLGATRALRACVSLGSIWFPKDNYNRPVLEETLVTGSHGDTSKAEARRTMTVMMRVIMTCASIGSMRMVIR